MWALTTKFIKIIFIYFLLLSMLSSCKQVAETGPITNETEPIEQARVKSVDFCSDLELEQIDWPRSMNEVEIDLYALALNITGSYEGFSDFRNLTNNFDGQGVSLGIFQQNLGQGSLQPLLQLARDNNYDLFKQHFNSQQRESILTMLSAWEAVKIANSDKKMSSLSPMNHINGFNKLDIYSEFISQQNPISAFMASNARNQDSVDWAVNNLYQTNIKRFKTSWKESLQAFAGDPRYVSLQVEAGSYLHDKAMFYMKRYDAYELRSYLFFFDIAVQNGSVGLATEKKYRQYIKENPGLSENEKMKVLLDYRLDVVIQRYRDDVASRKLAILTGKGVVHKLDRNFPQEYCIKDWTAKIR